MSDGIRIQSKDDLSIIYEVDEVSNYFDLWKWRRLNNDGTMTYYSVDAWRRVPPTPKTENVTGACETDGRYITHNDGETLVAVMYQLAIENGFSLEQVEAYEPDDHFVKTGDVSLRKQSFIRITRTTEEPVG